jgi:hypothetical protein
LKPASKLKADQRRSASALPDGDRTKPFSADSSDDVFVAAMTASEKQCLSQVDAWRGAATTVIVESA